MYLCNFKLRKRRNPSFIPFYFYLRIVGYFLRNKYYRINKYMITFEEAGIEKDALKAITELGFENPTPIQEKTIPHLLNEQEQDLLAFAQTGTGKTAAFGLPIIQQVNVENKDTQAIILAPTRELCIQIAKDLESYAKYIKGLKVVPVYGGASIDTQVKALHRGAQVVVGTPGRTLDLIKRKKLKLFHVSWLVLDEADEMLNMGFKEELDGILSDTPAEKQTLLFSATMPKEVKRISREYMRNPLEIRVGKENAGADNVAHQYFMVKAKDKYAALKRIADINPEIYAIVFCRTRRETKEIADKLIQDGYNADALHGDLSQAQRDVVMQRFRFRGLQLLIATDVAARGLDVSDLTHVINYNLPDDPEAYVHRSGRTGRAGKKGISIAIINSKENNKIRVLERMVQKSFSLEKVPEGEDIVAKRLFHLIDNMKQEQVEETRISPFMDQINEQLEDLSKEDIIKKFVFVEFKRFSDYYKNAKDINYSGSGREERKERGKTGMNFSRFYINLGTKNNINVPSLIGVINDNIRTRNVEIGRIDMMKRFSFFEIDEKYAKEVTEGFKEATYNGHRILVEPSNEKPQPSPDNGNYGKRRSRSTDNKRGSGGDRKRSYGNSYKSKGNSYSSKRRR